MAGANPLTVMPTMEADLGRVEAELREAVVSDNEYLTEISTHLISAGGKRIRPGFCIASAATALATDQPATPEVVRGGVAVELVHLGSLYHDDVMDDAVTRRTVESVNALWGNHRAILAGDFLLARASELAASLGVEVAGLLAATIGRLCEGQILELQHTYDIDRTVEDYFRSIDGKTAALLGTACRVGAIVAELPRPHVEALTKFGHDYGTAFQIVDDVLDLVSTSEALGKPAGHDLEEGVYTLPVLLTLEHGAPADAAELRSLLTDSLDPVARDRARDVIRGGEGIVASIDAARRHAANAAAALEPLPPSPGIRGLEAAARYLVDSVEAAAVPGPV
ncbi:MAG TPA: polyprenyl synthetase family protein [Microthrixaceae bacterium]|nr:polyprenyl synthetase family protein [Microthrixaceae bacterium]